MLSSVSTILVIIGVTGHFGLLDNGRYVEKFDDWEDKSNCIINQGEVFEEKIDYFQSECLKSGRDFILIGDSHAEALSKNLRIVIEDSGGSLISLVTNACFPITGTTRLNYNRECIEKKEKYWDFATTTNATIILSARWRLNINGTRFNNQEGGIEYGKNNGLNVVLDSDDELIPHIASSLLRLSQKNRVIIVNQIPEAGWDVPVRIAKTSQKFKSPAPSYLSTSYNVYKVSNEKINALFEDLENGGNLTVLRVDKLVCDTKLAGSA